MRRFVLALGVAGVLAGSATTSQAELPDREWTTEQREHWAFQPPVRPEVPEPDRKGWDRNPIDRFILADLESIDLDVTTEASKRTLIRRLRFDLTGLPPSPEEVAAFLADTRSDAYERLVDRLLATPEFGERWARPWLDLARYSESDGFKSDKTRPNAWRYRDWVVKALNDDMPYDRFVALQVAGEEIEPENPDAFIASGFNRNYPFEDNNMVPGLNRQLMLDDMTDTTASVFMALTVGCARCHDHKFDAISQKDYYRLEAIFGATAPRDDRTLADPFETAVHEFVSESHAEKLAKARRDVETLEQPYVVQLLKDKLASLPQDLRKAIETEPLKRSAFQEELIARNPKAMAVDAKAMKAMMTPEEQALWESRTAAMKAVEKKAPNDLPSASGMAVDPRGAEPVFLLRKGAFGQPVEEVAPGLLSVLGTTTIDAASTSRRAELARWLTDPSHPLTARVMVNRIWQGHFGRGIVATPSDFGTQGSGPSNPALLDWLATEFIAQGWSMKAMHRLMVTSSTYRQSSEADAKILADDPDNMMFGRMPRLRLQGEAVRDAMLAVSGQLNPKVGGPSVFPDLPPGVETRGGWTRSDRASDRNRKSLYVFSRRNLKYPLFDAFDAPDPNITCAERNVSVNAPQALMLMNSELILETARKFADRVKASTPAGDDANQVVQAYRLALSREPDPSELERSLKFLESGQEQGSETLVDLCHALLNLNEFVFVD